MATKSHNAAGESNPFISTRILSVSAPLYQKASFSRIPIHSGDYPDFFYQQECDGSLCFSILLFFFANLLMS
jgi:hypothetical protein